MARVSAAGMMMVLPGAQEERAVGTVVGAVVVVVAAVVVVAVGRERSVAGVEEGGVLRSTGAGGEGVGGADGGLMEEELTAMEGWRSAVSMGG